MWYARSGLFSIPFITLLVFLKKKPNRLIKFIIFKYIFPYLYVVQKNIAFNSRRGNLHLLIVAFLLLWNIVSQFPFKREQQSRTISVEKICARILEISKECSKEGRWNNSFPKESSKYVLLRYELFLIKKILFWKEIKYIHSCKMLWNTNEKKNELLIIVIK